MDKPKIMVVDNEPAIGELLTRFLTKKNYEVTSFTSGKEALEYLKTHEVDPVRKSTDNGDNNVPDSNRNTAKLSNGVDLLVTDMAMPGLTGIELARNVKTLYPALPVIVMSGSADGSDRDEIFSLGADFIYKPFELVELLERVEAKCPDVTSGSKCH